MIDPTQLLTLCKAYAIGTDCSDKTVSYRVFGDSKKITALKDGADITVSRFNDAIKWFSANWPDGLAWPKDVERPTVSGTAGTETPDRGVSSLNVTAGAGADAPAGGPLNPGEAA